MPKQQKRVHPSLLKSMTASFRFEDAARRFHDQLPNNKKVLFETITIKENPEYPFWTVSYKELP